MIFKQIRSTTDNSIRADHEEIPQEELWEDGELSLSEVQDKVIYHTLDEGDWMIVRRIDG